MKIDINEARENFAAQLAMNRLAQILNCPIYDGVGAIKPSDSPYVVIKAPGRAAGLTVRRETVEGGIPDDIEAWWEDEQLL